MMTENDAFEARKNWWDFKYDTNRKIEDLKEELNTAGFFRRRKINKELDSLKAQINGIYQQDEYITKTDFFTKTNSVRFRTIPEMAIFYSVINPKDDIIGVVLPAIYRDMQREFRLEGKDTKYPGIDSICIEISKQNKPILIKLNPIKSNLSFEKLVGYYQEEAPNNWLTNANRSKATESKPAKSSSSSFQTTETEKFKN